MINQKKKNYRQVDFVIPQNIKTKIKESEKRDKYLDLARELKKSERNQSNGDTNRSWCSWGVSKGLEKSQEVLEFRERIT